MRGISSRQFGSSEDLADGILLDWVHHMLTQLVLTVGWYWSMTESKMAPLTSPMFIRKPCLLHAKLSIASSTACGSPGGVVCLTISSTACSFLPDMGPCSTVRGKQSKKGVLQCCCCHTPYRLTGPGGLSPSKLPSPVRLNLRYTPNKVARNSFTPGYWSISCARAGFLLIFDSSVQWALLKCSLYTEINSAEHPCGRIRHCTLRTKACAGHKRSL